MMKIYIGADHRGFALKQQLIDWLKKQKYDAEDCGNAIYNPKDDYPDFAGCVAQSVSKNLDRALGIVICGSGVGVSIAANRYKNIRAAVAVNHDQVQHAKVNDHINVLALAADYNDLEHAKKMIEIFLAARPNTKEKYLRRIKKLDTASSQY